MKLKVKDNENQRPKKSKAFLGTENPKNFQVFSRFYRTNENEIFKPLIFKVMEE